MRLQGVVVRSGRDVEDSEKLPSYGPSLSFVMWAIVSTP